MLPLCPEAIAASTREELAPAFGLMRTDSIKYRLINQALSRKYDILEQQWITAKEENEEIEYQFGKLRDATVVARAALRNEDLTYAALMVALRMESSSRIKTRKQAFKKMGKTEESFLIAERLLIEAKEAKAVGTPDMEARIVDFAMNNAMKKGKTALGEGEENEPLSAEALLGDVESTNARLLRRIEDVQLGEGGAKPPKVQGLPALDSTVISAMSASDQITHSNKVCKVSKDAAAKAKKTAAASVARNAENEKMKVRREASAKNSNAICATTTAQLKNSPDDITLAATNEKECLRGTAYTLEANKLIQSIKREAEVTKTTTAASAKAAASSIKICAKADEIIAKAQIIVKAQRALAFAVKSHTLETLAKDAKAQASIDLHTQRTKLAKLNKTPAKTGAEKLQLAAVQREVDAAVKKSFDASQGLAAAIAARKAAVAALSDTQKEALAEKLLLSYDPAKNKIRAALLTAAGKAAQAEVDRLHALVAGQQTKQGVFGKEIKAAEAAVARKGPAEGVIALQQTMLTEKVKALAILKSGGSGSATQQQTVARDIADIKARISAATDTVNRANTAAAKLPQLRKDLTAASELMVSYQTAATKAVAEVKRLRAEAEALEKTHKEALAFQAEMKRDAGAGGSSGPISAAKAREEAEAAKIKADVAAKAAAREKKIADAAAARAKKDAARVAADAKAENAAAGEEKAAMERKRKEREELEDPKKMNMIILQEKFKSLVKEYQAIKQIHEISVGKDKDMREKAAKEKGIFDVWTKKFWALSKVSDDIGVKLDSALRKTAALKPAKKGKGFVAKPIV